MSWFNRVPELDRSIDKLYESIYDIQKNTIDTLNKTLDIKDDHIKTLREICDIHRKSYDDLVATLKNYPEVSKIIWPY